MRDIYSNSGTFSITSFHGIKKSGIFPHDEVIKNGLKDAKNTLAFAVIYI